MVPKAFLPIEGDDGWPRTSSAKVDRKELTARAKEHLEQADVQPAIDDPDEAREAGIDSLGLMRSNIQVAITRSP